MTKPAIDTATPTPAPQPAKRRTRGPNKPKPVDTTIMVTTEATMPQVAIVKVLADYASKMLGADAAAKMELQIGGSGSGWESLADHKDATAVAYAIRFATKGSK